MLSDLLKDPESMKLLRSSMSGDSDHNTKSDHNLCFPCIVYSSMRTKPQLPISIAQTLPTIAIKLGQSTDTVNPGIEVIVDTGLAICVAWALFVLEAAKRFPHLVKSLVYANNEYDAIKLAEIISADNKNNALTTLSW